MLLSTQAFVQQIGFLSHWDPYTVAIASGQHCIMVDGSGGIKPIAVAKWLPSVL